MRAIEIDCSFFDNLSDAILIYDKEGKIIYASKSVENVLMVKREKIIGKNILEIKQEEEGGIFKFGNIKFRSKEIETKDGMKMAIISYVGEEMEDVFMGIVGRSKKMKEIFELIKKIGPTDSPLLIEGETGVGKELVAEAIHKISQRKGPLVKLNCAAVPENLLESELFGYKKGAFTGAESDKPGKFSLANYGTLVLDEIGDMPLPLQAKLLRAIDKKEIDPLGAIKPEKVDVRIIAITNKKLERMVEEGKFRDDLYFRISVFKIYVPPLRERKEDIPLIVDFIIEKLSRRYGFGKKKISPKALQILLSYDFPGNIRELENILERAYILSDEIIKEDNIIINDKIKEDKIIKKKNKDEKLKFIIENYLKKKYKIVDIAKEIGVHRSTVWRIMKKFGLEK